MLRGIVATACTLLLLTLPEGQPPPPVPPADTQPATRPADAPPALRRPAQADILHDLLRQRERVTPILPQRDEATTTTRPAGDQSGQATQPLLLEGTFLIERPGHFVDEDGKPVFVFYLDGDADAPFRVEILKNQLLETLEREARAGFTEFIISAEITTYGGQNHLLLRKVLRRVAHGNLSP